MGGSDAFLMLPPETACGSEATEIVWSADGTNLVVRRQTTEGGTSEIAQAFGVSPPPGMIVRPMRKVELVVWTVASRTVRTVFSIPTGSGTLNNLSALSGSDSVVFDTFARIPATGDAPERLVFGVSLLSTKTGAIARLAETVAVAESDFGQPVYVLAKNRPLGAVLRPVPSGEGFQARFFGPSGLLGNWLPKTLPEALVFDAAGKPGYPVTVKVGGKPTARFQRIDPATGNPGSVVDFSPVDPPPVASTGNSQTSAPSETEEPLLSVQAFFAPTAKPAPDAPSILLHVRGGKPDETGVVTTDGARPLLSPKLDAVAYVYQGVAMVRPLVRVPRSAFEKARDDALRQVAVNNAKQAALAALMYAADNDDVFPANGGDVQGRLYPYLKSRDILNGFSYTFRGGNMTEIENPATTELGYVSGPGGRAVAYTDGHVKWVPDTP